MIYSIYIRLVMLTVLAVIVLELILLLVMPILLYAKLVKFYGSCVMWLIVDGC